MQNTLLPGSLVVKQQQQNAYPVVLPNQSVDVQHLALATVLQVSGYNAIVGTTLQVTNGAASHDTIAAALASGAKTILILAGTYVEAVAVPVGNQVIVGQGFSTLITGTVTYGATSNYGAMKNLRIGGNLVFAAGAVGNFVTECWQATTFTITEGVVGANIISVWQE